MCIGSRGREGGTVRVVFCLCCPEERLASFVDIGALVLHQKICDYVFISDNVFDVCT